MPTASRRRRVPVLFFLALLLLPLLLLLIGLEIVRGFDNSRRARAELDRSYETRAQIQQVFSLIQDAETGQRGYLITGDGRFLKPYDDAVGQLDREMEALGLLLVYEPRQQADHARLQALTRHKLALMQRGVEVRRRQGASAAAVLVAGGRGRQAMDDIRAVISRMVATEADLLETHARVADARTRRTEWVVGALFLMLFGVIAVALTVGWRYILDRRRMYDAIQATAARQRAVFDSVTDGIVTLRPDGLIENANEAAERLLGYAPGELDGLQASALIDIPPERRGAFTREIAAAVRDASGRGLLRQLEARRRDGSTFPADVAFGAMALPTGDHVVAVVRDITERRRMERMKGEFVSTVSHELRTPLTSIAGSLGLLAGGAAGALPDKAARLIQIAHANSLRLIRLINDILDIEKIDSGKLQLEMAPVDLRDVATRSLEGVRGYADGLGVVLTLLDGEPVPVLGDTDRMIQVITNLLSNAVKFSPKGGEVRLSVKAEGSQARLSVDDDGPGIPEDFRSRIFSRFAQADGSDTRAKGGTGLGLAIAREIAERHGGRLWFESEPGRGAIFHLDLPLRLDAAAAAGDGPRLLIVEDDPDAAEVLREMLERDGYAADIAMTSREGLHAARSGAYAALLVDLNLPDADGISLIRTLRAQAETRDLPVVVVSADVARGKARGRALEVVDWMEKPFDQNRLRIAVAAMRQRHLDRRPRVLHVDDDRDILEVTASVLAGVAEVLPAGSLAEAREVLGRLRPDLVILDLGLPDGSGLELLPDLEEDDGRAVPVVVYSAHESDAAVADRVEAVLTKSRTSLSGLARTVRRLTETPRPHGA